MKKIITLATALGLACGLGLPARAQSEDESAPVAADAPEEAAPASEPAAAPASDAPWNDAVPIETTAAPASDEPAAPPPAAAAPALPAAPEADAPPPAPQPEKSRKKARRAPASLKIAKVLAQGRQAERAQQYSRAITIYERATRIDSSSAEAFLHLGNAYFSRAFVHGNGSVDKDDAQGAVDAYETALGLDPKLASVSNPYTLYHGLSQCHEALGNYGKALASLKGAAKSNPDNPMPHLYGARIRTKLGETDKASANLYWSARRALKLNMYPQLSKLVRTDPMFAGLMGQPRSKVIMESFDAVSRGSLTEEQAKERIRAAGTAEDLRDAVRDVPTLSTSRPRSMDIPAVDEAVMARIEDGHRAYEAGAFSDAAAAYHAAVTADKTRGSMDTVMRSLVYERLGSAYRHLGHAGEASRVLSKAVESLPNNSSAHYELALCLAIGGRPGDSLSALNRALDTAATMPQLRKTLIMAKTDPELASIRDLPRFKLIVESHSRKLSARR
ncbi:MAG: tetratricopeptide repeat protein [Elusimicrobia bacterium]|nr:tetratricopeptide repeat protein [Elusimicrobiota bacterium]